MKLRNEERRRWRSVFSIVYYFVFSEWSKVKSWKSHEAQYFESYINCRILETTLLQVCSTNPNPNMPLQTYAILCNLYPRRYIAPVCLKQLTWWWLSEMHQLSEMNAYRFLRNFLKTHIGNENPELPEEKINRVNRWSVSRFQHSYWLSLFTLQSKIEKSGKLPLNFSNLFRIFAFLQGSWATKCVKLLVMLSINYVGLP